MKFVPVITWPKLFSLFVAAFMAVLGLAGYLQRDAHARTELVEHRVQNLEVSVMQSLDRIERKVDRIEERTR